MAPKCQVSKDFLKQVFTGEKTLLKKKDVDYIHVAHFEELSVKNFWGQMKQDKNINIYFQDEYPKERYPCRDYFFNILNTTYPEYLEQIMKHAATERYSSSGIKQKEQAIKANDEWYEALSSMPFISCKYLIKTLLTIFNLIERPGKCLHLLKANSKKINPTKKRLKIPLMGTIKEY